MSESGREALPDVWEWLRGTPGCVGVVGSPSWMSESGQGGPPGCRGVVGRPYRMSRSGREALPDVRVCLEALPYVG